MLDAFEAHVVTVPPGGRRAHDDAEWRGALVVITQGEIELEMTDDTSCRLARGAVLWLTGLSLRALRNPGATPAVLVGVARRPAQAPRSP
jgi:hypothetical protein